MNAEESGNSSIKLTVRIYSLRELENILDTAADNIILSSPGELLDGTMGEDKVLQRLIEKNKSGKHLIIDTPDIIYDRDMDKLKPEIDNLIKCGVKHFRVSNPGVLELLRQHDNMKKSNGIMISIGNIFNISNILALDFYKKMIKDGPGLSGFELSPEINTGEIRSIIDSFKRIYENGGRYIFSVFAHGFFRVMAARYDAPYYKKASGSSKMGLFLEDRKKYRFRVAGDKNGNTLVYNSKNICTIFDLDRIISSGINDLVIDSIFTGPEDIKKIIKKYREALAIYRSCREDKYSLFVKDLSRDPLFSDYSKGHLFRGVE